MRENNNNNDKIPYSFMLLRIMGQVPMLHLKFAFQASATTVERHKIIEDFRTSLVRLRPRSRMKSGNMVETNRKQQQTSTPISSKSSPSHRTIVNSPPCCVILNKNIERLMLKPDPFPYESLGIPRPEEESSQQHKNRSDLDSKRQALAKFFYLRTFVRSFQSIKHSTNIPKRTADMIVDTFIRRRLQEGFHFAMSHNDIHNLVLEVKMNSPKDEQPANLFRPNVAATHSYIEDKTRTCLVQYRIYPVECGRPTDASPLRENRSMLVRRSSSIYCDQSTCYYFLTQCWIEPQDGCVETNCSELEFLNSCTYKQIVDKIGDVDRECFNTLVSFYFVKHLQERNIALSRPILRAPRALTADIIRVPFMQDTINLIRRSHQTFLDFSAFIDDYDKLRNEYITNDGTLPFPSLNSTLLNILHDRLCTTTYKSKPQLFLDDNTDNGAFTRALISRTTSANMHRLPIGLRSLKSHPYLLYLLDDSEQHKIRTFSPLEEHLIDRLFPRWNFLVCAEVDDHIYMVLLPKSERDLLLLNTDLNLLMHDLIGQYSVDNIDQGKPIYTDCRNLLDQLIDEIESTLGSEPPPVLIALTTNIPELPQNKYSQRRRQRRETFTAADFLLSPGTTSTVSGKTTLSSSPIPIVHNLSIQPQHSLSQPASIGHRRIHSPLTVDTGNAAHFEPSTRRYSASAAVSPPGHHHNLLLPPIFNLIPPSPQQNLDKRSNDRQWHIPVLLYGCSKTRLASSLLSSNEQQLRHLWTDAYIDCTKDDTELIPIQNTFKPRKRENPPRRHDDEVQVPHEKQVEEMRDSLDYAFATAFYKNCLLDLITHRSDVEYALSTIYQEHYEDIDLTPFLKAMCGHLQQQQQTDILLEPNIPCQPTTNHLETYLHEKFLDIVGKYFRRVTSDSDYFYFCTDDERTRQNRFSLELEDRTTTTMMNNNNEMTPPGPYKFDETSEHEPSSDEDGNSTSTGTVHVHDDDEIDTEFHRRRSDVSTSSLSNRSREISAPNEILPLFICFDCRLVMKDYDNNMQVKTVPICTSNLVQNSNETKIDLNTLRVWFSLICLTFGREENDLQIGMGNSAGVTSTNTPTLVHSLVSSVRRYQETLVMDVADNTSTCTGTTMGGDPNNKNPLEKLRLSDAQRCAIRLCRREIEWLLRDEQLSTYFCRRTLDKKLIENVIEHVESSVDIHKSNCLCRSIDLMFVLGIDKSLRPFLDELRHICIRDKYILTKCSVYYVLIEPNNDNCINERQKSSTMLSRTLSGDDPVMINMEDSITSDTASCIDDDDDRKSTEDELDDYVKPSFWLFVEQKKKPSDLVELLEVKFYLYCGSSSDTSQKSIEPYAILDELIDGFNRLCRMINQKLLLSSLGSTRLCNALLVPPGENDDTTFDNDAPMLTANLELPPGTFACEELWTHAFPLHFRLRPHLHASPSLKAASGNHPGSLLRELATHFGSLAVYNRKNLFVYSGKRNQYFYIRFREDIHPPSSTFVDDSILLNDSHPFGGEPPSPQINNPTSAIRNRQRHDSGHASIHVMLYGLKSATTDPSFEIVKSNLVHSIISRLEDEIVKELVNALYHFAMTRLNPDDVTFIRPIDSEPKHVFEFEISSLINTNVFLYYFRRYIKTNQFHQPLLLPALAKDLKDIVKDYRGQILIVYSRTYNIRIPRQGLAWIELHVLNSSNRPSPLSTEDLSDELHVDTLIDLTKIVERQPISLSSTITNDDLSTNILRCHVWARGSPSEIDPNAMSNTLLQAFTFALTDYVTEYKLLPILYNNHRQTSSDPPPSPRSNMMVKFADEPILALDRSMPNTRTLTIDNIPTTPTAQSRRRHESIPGTILHSTIVDEPQILSIENVQCLTKWFQYLNTTHSKLPSLRSCSHLLNNRILLLDIIHSFILWLNEQKFIAYKHETLHGMVFCCNRERTFYLPVPSLDQLPPRVPGQNLDLIALYRSSKLTTDMTIDSLEASPQQESGDAMALANSSDIPKQIFLCIIANDKKLTMILHNAPDELSKPLISNFTEVIDWANKRLDVLNIIVTQKMGLFRFRSLHYEQHTDHTRHHGTTNKHHVKGENIELEQLIKDTSPPKTIKTCMAWNIDLLYCNLIGSYPILANDFSQDLIQRHGLQLLQLKENKKIQMDRCTRLEEICTNWASTPKLPITDHLLNQMKHRSRLLGIAVVPLLFSRPARNLFQNDSTLRANNTLSLNEYQIAQGQFLRGDPSRSTTDQVQHLQAMQNFAEQFCSHLQSTYKFQQMSTKLTPRKIARSVHVPSPIEFNLHRSDHSRRATVLAEVSTLNNVQLIVRFLQYDTVKFSSNSNRRVISSDFRSSDLSWIAPEQTELDAFAYDFHLQRIVRHQTNPDELQGFTGDFSLIVFLQDFIEYYPQAPIGAKTALFKTCIRHQLDGNKRTGDSSLLFKYVLDRAANYNIRAAKRMSDEYLFDCDSPDVHWIAARSTPSSSTELFISMYIIYTNLSPKQQNTPILTAPSLNKQPIASTNRPRTSLTSNNSSNNIRERSTTVLLPPPKVNLVVPIRSNSFSSDQSTQNNIPKERNVEYFKSKLTSILNKASVSHRREHLWSKLIALRSDGIDRRREDSTPINDIEFEILLDSCVGDEKLDLNLITSLLQRVFANREQTERLNKFLRSRYNNQYHILNSINATYLIILQCKTSQQCDAFLVLAYRSDQNSLKSYLVKHQSDIDCATFIETFTQRISYFLWECLV